MIRTICNIIFLNIDISGLFQIIAVLLMILMYLYPDFTKLLKNLEKIKWKKLSIKLLTILSFGYILITPFYFVFQYDGEINKDFILNLSIKLFFASIGFTLLLALIYQNLKLKETKQQKERIDAKYKEYKEYLENIKHKNKETIEKIQKQQDDLLMRINNFISKLNNPDKPKNTGK